MVFSCYKPEIEKSLKKFKVDFIFYGVLANFLITNISLGHHEAVVLRDTITLPELM
jgi:hypothetical protein